LLKKKKKTCQSLSLREQQAFIFDKRFMEILVSGFTAFIILISSHSMSTQLMSLMG